MPRIELSTFPDISIRSCPAWAFASSVRGLGHPRVFDLFDVGKLGIGFQRTSHGGDPNLGSTCTPQDPGALRGSRSGGEDIIDQQDLLAGDEVRMLDAK